MSTDGETSLPLVTVLMPIHNGEAFVADAVESILRQTFRNFEFLVIDDGSTDGSVGIVEKYGDSRIRLVRNEQQIELIRTLNLGLGLARGRFVARMDADDISLPERLERQVAFLEANPDVGACGTWAVTMGDREGVIRAYPESAGAIRCQLLFGAALAHPSVCMRRDAFVRHRLQFDEAYPHAEDYQLWRTASEKFPLANIGEVLIRYRIHTESVSQRCPQQQEATVRRIHEEALSALGLTPTEDELFVHGRIAAGGHAGEALHLRDVGAWLEKLLRANAERGVYPRDVFERLLGGYWLAAAYRAAGSGRPEFARFLLSPLARRVDFNQKIRWVTHAAKRSVGIGLRRC
jgi:glycosyltransferase involved in cell wall biosynthesis